MPPYLLFRDYLPADMAAALLAWAIENEAQFTPTTVGAGDAQRENPLLRVSDSVRKFGPFKQELRRRLLETAPALIRDLRVNNLEVGSAELELVAHNDGAFYGRHIDTFTGAEAEGGSLRFISAVYYFHQQPKGYSGGALRLHRFGGEDDGDFIDIAPEHNLLVVFPSWAPHQVMPVSCPSREFAHSRFAVNIWILSAAKERSQEPAAPAP